MIKDIGRFKEELKTLIKERESSYEKTKSEGDEMYLAAIYHVTNLLRGVDQLERRESVKVSINPSQLFNSRNDVRNYMTVGIRDEKYAELVEDYGDLTVEEIMDEVTLYFRADKLPKEMELELEEYKPVLPLVPDCVANEIRHVQKKECEKEGGSKYEDDDFVILEEDYMKAQDWKEDNMREYCLAYTIGYDLEERIYKVAVDQGDGDWTYAGDGKKSFETSVKAEADTLASILGGQVVDGRDWLASLVEGYEGREEGDD